MSMLPADTHRRLELPVPPPPLTRCASGSDGTCCHMRCPQARDGEPAKSGRPCPLIVGEK